jgi:hypothetical protein
MAPPDLRSRARDLMRAAGFEPPTRPGAIVEPPSSQRPIPIPESARVSTSDIPRGDVVEKPKRASAGRAKRS